MIKGYKGNILFSESLDTIKALENGYIFVKNGKVESVCDTLPEKYKDVEIEDFGDKLIIPSFMDVHLHAPQWLNKGVGYSEELLPWLEKYTFPLESNFEDEEFAEKYYSLFVDELVKSGTTRACIFASRHYKATKMLLEMLKKSGIGGFVGKVNMDRNSSESLQEKTEDSIRETIALAEEYPVSGDSLVKFIATPRFVPSTTPELMTELGKVVEKYGLYLQSHLDENRSEIAWVRELHPDIPSFTEVYEHFGLMPDDRTVMAHCIHNTDEEIDILKKHNVLVAHCPLSNFNLSSGIMPLRRYLNKGIRVGLGSDVSGGHTLYMPETCVAAINASKINYVMNSDEKALSFNEAFYLMTRGGGMLFGKVGAFEEGFDFDALVIDDSDLNVRGNLSLAERLEKFIYTGAPKNILHSFCQSNRLF